VALRLVGNIGAHTEKDVNLIIDVEPAEARAMIELVELFIEETYIARHKREQRLQRAKDVTAHKEAIKKSLTP
jgi:hypothetical protein